MSASSWSGLDRPSSSCRRCEGRLAPPPDGPGAAYAVLHVVEGALVREDVCPACFEALPVPPATYWRRTIAAPAGDGAEDRRTRRQRENDALLALFERLADRPAPVSAAPAETGAEDPASERKLEGLRYLLALALVRRRQLELLDLARVDGADCLVLRRSGGPDRITVPAPRVPQAELERLLQELRRELEAA